MPFIPYLSSVSSSSAPAAIAVVHCLDPSVLLLIPQCASCSIDHSHVIRLVPYSLRPLLLSYPLLSLASPNVSVFVSFYQVAPAALLLVSS